MTAADERAQLLGFIVDRVELGIFVLDRELRVVLWNNFMATHSSRRAEHVLNRNIFECFPELPREWLEKKLDRVFELKNYAFTSWEQRPFLFRFQHNRPVTGGVEYMYQNCTFLPVERGEETVKHVCVTVMDYTDSAIYHKSLQASLAALEREHAAQRKLVVQLEEAHGQLMQSEKLASIGQLAAGVAHEINNPIGFVSSNVNSLAGYTRQLIRLIDAYGECQKVLARDPAALERISGIIREIDLEFLKEDVPTLLSESAEGLDRVKRIVEDLKNFSRLGATQREPVDLHACLESTLRIAANEIKYKAEVIKEYGSLPEVECTPSQLNQVFMNLLTNAAQAITERGQITLRTAVARAGDEDWAVVSVSDTGTGIAPEVLNRIFDPFFTTKPVGKGTGLGLSVSYSIVKGHGGRIEVETQLGKGSTFSVWLSLRRAQSVGIDRAPAPLAAARPEPLET